MFTDREYQIGSLGSYKGPQHQNPNPGTLAQESSLPCLTTYKFLVSTEDR